MKGRKRTNGFKYVPKTTARFIIGIDTGVDTGIAIWDRKENRLLEVMTRKLHQAMDIVRMYDKISEGDIYVRIEDARLRKWIPRQKNEKAERGRAQGAGSVKRDASIWEDALTDYGIKHEMVAPIHNKTKLEEGAWIIYTGWTGKTSEHSRDATMLCWKY